MPKVTIDAARGLVQTAGSGLEVNTTVSLNSNLDLGGVSVLSGPKQNVVTFTASDTLIASSSSDVMMLVQTNANRSTTLPAPTAGLNFKFILKTAAANKWEIVTADVSHDLVGSVLYAAPVVVDGHAGGDADHGATVAISDTAINTDTIIRFVGGTAVAGDWVSLQADGSKWYVSGMSTAAGGIVFA